jgi:hypothetical protein
MTTGRSVTLRRQQPPRQPRCRAADTQQHVGGPQAGERGHASTGAGGGRAGPSIAYANVEKSCASVMGITLALVAGG